MLIDFRTHDKIVEGDTQNLERTTLVFSIGERGRLNRRALAAAVLAWRALRFKTSTAVLMHFGGYDDDPRELWEIPEVRDFIRRFCAKTKAHEHPAVDPTSRNLLLACGADPTHQVRVVEISTAEALQRTEAFLANVMKT
jgi:hypothetical protein